MKKREFKNFLPLKTDRLIIREISLNDVGLLLKMDKQEETQKYLGGIKDKTYEERLKFLEKSLLKPHSVSLTISLLDNTSIGIIGIKMKDLKTCELSYIFDYDYTSNGYCSESVEKILELLFNKLNIETLIAESREDNIASRKVLEKLGFKKYKKEIKNNYEFILYIKERVI